MVLPVTKVDREHQSFEEAIDGKPARRVIIVGGGGTPASEVAISNGIDPAAWDEWAATNDGTNITKIQYYLNSVLVRTVDFTYDGVFPSGCVITDGP